jgi:heptosyltransferase II
LYQNFKSKNLKNLNTRKEPAPERIIVRGVNWLGDAVMTMPALCRLRQACPDAHIAVLTPSKLAELYACQPAVDAIVTTTRDEPVTHLSRRMRTENFDTCLIFTNSLGGAYPFWRAGIPRRIGYAEGARRLLLTHPVRRSRDMDKIRRRSPAEIRRAIARAETVFAADAQKPSPPARHHIHHFLNLVAVLGADKTPLPPALHVGTADRDALIRRFGLPTPNNRYPLFGLNAGAEYGLAKRWPPERFLTAAIAIQQQTDCRWILFGGKADVELASRLEHEIQAKTNAERAPSGGPQPEKPAKTVWNLAGQTNLRELCAALSLCSVVLTNDTGPMHIAAAVGTPVVVPFGSTSSALTGPGLPGDTRHRLLQSAAPCAPCFQRVCPIDFRCMNTIRVSDVVDAVLSLHEKQP